MVKYGQLLREFEDIYARSEGPIPRDKALNIVAAMWEEAMRLGKIPFADSMEGIETDFKMARVINSCFNKSSVR